MDSAMGSESDSNSLGMGMVPILFSVLVCMESLR